MIARTVQLKMEKIGARPNPKFPSSAFIWWYGCSTSLSVLSVWWMTDYSAKRWDFTSRSPSSSILLLCNPFLAFSLFSPITLVFLPMLFTLSPFDLRFIYQFSVFFPSFYFDCRSEAAWLRRATALKFMPAHILFHIVLLCCWWDGGGFGGCPAGSGGRGDVWCQCEGKRVEG